MLAWLKRLFSRAAPAQRSTVPVRALTPERPAQPPTPLEAPRAPLPVDARAPSPEPDAPPRAARPAAAVKNLDAFASGGVSGRRDAMLLARAEERLRARRFELPTLPSTSIAAIGLSSRPGVEIAEIVTLIEKDPALSSELLKVANSAYYAGREEVRTLQVAAVRIGIRSLRSLIYSVSVRGAVLRDRHLSAYAEEVWRQASSVGAIARAIGPRLGFEPERAFLIGLLQDVGKIPLLSILRQEVGRESEIGPALVGKLFHVHHELAGEALAQAWKLPEEIASVAGCHHDFARNEGHGRAAALASLAHRIDLGLSLEPGFDPRTLVDAPELEFLGVDRDARYVLLETSAGAFVPAG